MKILQIGLGNVAGGLEAFVMNYYSVLAGMDVQFDFVCMYDKIAYEEEIRRLGGKIYYIPNVKKNYIGYVKGLKKVFEKETYDAVHVNMLSAANIVPLRIAHKMKIKRIIAHSHSSSCPGAVRKLMDWWNRPKIDRYATVKAACGDLAAKWMFGEKAVRNGEVTVIPNAISVDRFVFDKKKRESLRKKLGWENKFVIGHVGRFDIPKNHEGMIDMFREVRSCREDAVLCLVGGKEGLYDKIKEKVGKLNLEGSVYFAGKQEDIPGFLSAMDVFLFPSIFEGVPFALIEAQANDLPCVISDSVSEEAVVFPERVKCLSLQAGNQTWANAICSLGQLKRGDAQEIRRELTKKHFDIKTEAGRLKKLYRE